MITGDSIRRFAPQARDDYIQALVDGAGEIMVAGINNPLILSHFMGAMSHETGGFTIIREDTRWTPQQMKALWPSRFPLGPTDPRIILARREPNEAPQKLANLAYSDRAELGNQGGDDGWEYRGGGLLQITGRDCFRAAGDALSIDLENQPDLIEDPTVSLRVALWYWTTKTGYDLSVFAQHNYGRTVANGINRGNPFSSKDPIGYQDRGRRFQQAWAIWGEGNPLPTSDTLYLGAYGPKVERVQAQLKDLGYPIGATDGVYGPAMARAVAGFKQDYLMRLGAALDEEGELIGPLTREALDEAPPIKLSPERTTATAATLIASGSTEARAGVTAARTGAAIASTGLAAGASHTGFLDVAMEPLKQVSALKATVVPALAAAQWSIQNLWWLCLIVAGVYLWRSGKTVTLARLAAHQLGWNLGR